MAQKDHLADPYAAAKTCERQPAPATKPKRNLPQRGGYGRRALRRRVGRGLARVESRRPKVEETNDLPDSPITAGAG
jgi:hypothetical protein